MTKNIPTKTKGKHHETKTYTKIVICMIKS